MRINKLSKTLDKLSKMNNQEEKIGKLHLEILELAELWNTEYGEEYDESEKIRLTREKELKIKKDEHNKNIQYEKELKIKKDEHDKKIQDEKDKKDKYDKAQLEKELKIKKDKKDKYDKAQLEKLQNYEKDEAARKIYYNTQKKILLNKYREIEKLRISASKNKIQKLTNIIKVEHSKLQKLKNITEKDITEKDITEKDITEKKINELLTDTRIEIAENDKLKDAYAIAANKYEKEIEGIEKIAILKRKLKLYDRWWFHDNLTSTELAEKNKIDLSIANLENMYHKGKKPTKTNKIVVDQPIQNKPIENIKDAEKFDVVDQPIQNKPVEEIKDAEKFNVVDQTIQNKPVEEIKDAEKFNVVDQTIQNKPVEEIKDAGVIKYPVEFSNEYIKNTQEYNKRKENLKYISKLKYNIKHTKLATNKLKEKYNLEPSKQLSTEIKNNIYRLNKDRDMLKNKKLELKIQDIEDNYCILEEKFGQTNNPFFQVKMGKIDDIMEELQPKLSKMQADYILKYQNA
jgi:hypothetical protein